MNFSAVLADLVAEGSDSAGFVAAAVEELKRAAAGRKADDKRRSNMMVGNDWGGKVGRCAEMMWDEGEAVELLKIAGKVVLVLEDEEEERQHNAAQAVRGQRPPTSLFSM